MGHPRVAYARQALSTGPRMVSWLLLLAEHRRRRAQERQTAESNPGWYHGRQCTVRGSKLDFFLYCCISIFLACLTQHEKVDKFHPMATTRHLLGHTHSPRSHVRALGPLVAG